MIKSIQQFQTDGVKNLEKIFCNYSDDPTKIAEMVQGVTKTVVDLGLSMIAEEWEAYDQLLRSRKDLRPGWQIVRRDKVSKITSLGEVTYHKTYFYHPKKKEYCYLLDRLMGMEAGSRITEDAVARMLEEAADSSYQKGGVNASISEAGVSKETVMDRIHALKFPKIKTPEEKKKVKTLYIDADEDHVALQYLTEKGDIREKRSNTCMPRLVYVYEGICTEGDRHELVNVKYFGGNYEGGDGGQQLWKEVYEYIDAAYEEEELECIYVNGDGAEWIKTGAQFHRKAEFVLDKFHMGKYIIKATSHLADSAEDVRSEIYRAINGRRKKETEKIFDSILAVTESESRRKAVETSRNYIMGQWKAVMTGVKNRKDSIHCSAEGHISHIYSDRLSSRPLGWSRTGADRMARLRVYRKNGGSMLELVRYQKEEKSAVTGAEEVIYTATDMLKMERHNRKRLGNMADMPVYEIPYPQIKKIAALKNQIWGL